MAILAVTDLCARTLSLHDPAGKAEPNRQLPGGPVGHAVDLGPDVKPLPLTRRLVQLSLYFPAFYMAASWWVSLSKSGRKRRAASVS